MSLYRSGGEPGVQPESSSENNLYTHCWTRSAKSSSSRNEGGELGMSQAPAATGTAPWAPAALLLLLLVATVGSHCSSSCSSASSHRAIASS